ncbi:L-arabinokinase [Camellia lanceoleosa]|uniref:L-arabinokinase n=1 Tax=Camellia lanceoleosa TaxID=1840588 RepID=A0ACC0IEQ3_9ERIC|nr:L-arabinokinase [Camellia lanceoleosa]
MSFSESFDNSLPLRLPSNVPGELGIEILEINTMNPENESSQREYSLCSSPDAEQTGRNLSMDELSDEVNYGIVEVPQMNLNSEAESDLSTLHQEPAGWKLKEEYLPSGWLCLVCGASDK